MGTKYFDQVCIMLQGKRQVVSTLELEIKLHMLKQETVARSNHLGRLIRVTFLYNI